MDFLLTLFGESVALITLIGLVKLTIGAFLIYLLICFLIEVPRELIRIRMILDPGEDDEDDADEDDE